jgi:hypothetical protein
MTGETFRLGETVLIECELESINSSISDVDIEIRSTTTNSIAVSGTTMEEMGNQKYRYFFDTRNGYSGTSGWSSYSAWANPIQGGPIIYSGWSGTCGYSSAISGLYTATVTARDSNDHIGLESFKIRIG